MALAMTYVYCGKQFKIWVSTDELPVLQHCPCVFLFVMTYALVLTLNMDFLQQQLYAKQPRGKVKMRKCFLS